MGKIIKTRTEISGIEIENTKNQSVYEMVI